MQKLFPILIRNNVFSFLGFSLLNLLWQMFFQYPGFPLIITVNQCNITLSCLPDPDMDEHTIQHCLLFVSCNINLIFAKSRGKKCKVFLFHQQTYEYRQCLGFLCKLEIIFYNNCNFLFFFFLSSVSSKTSPKSEERYDCAFDLL